MSSSAAKEAAAVPSLAATAATERFLFSVVNSKPPTSQLEQRLRKLAENRTVLGAPCDFGEKRIYSAIVERLIQTYVSEKRGAGPGRIYVLYAPPSSGKTIGAIYFFENVLLQLNTTGIMISGANQNYLFHMATVLGCDVTDPGWVHSLLAALMPGPASANTGHAPLLLLDEFDVEGDGNVNILFMNIFKQQVLNKGFFCIIQTQNKSLANKLCRMDTGQKIAPLPSVLQIPWLGFGDPEWDIVMWDIIMLTKLIHLRYPGRFTEETITWIEEGMTPTIAINEAEKRLRPKIASEEAFVADLKKADDARPTSKRQYLDFKTHEPTSKRPCLDSKTHEPKLTQGPKLAHGIVWAHGAKLTHGPKLIHGPRKDGPKLPDP